MTTSKEDNHRLWTSGVLEHPAVRRCIREIESVAGYRLAPAQRAPFLHFHAFITSYPPPSYITAWRSDPSRARWYRDHIRVLGDVQNAVACVWYHRDNLCAI